jgi:hypothetical protein
MDMLVRRFSAVVSLGDQLRTRRDGVGVLGRGYASEQSYFAHLSQPHLALQGDRRGAASVSNCVTSTPSCPSTFSVSSSGNHSHCSSCGSVSVKEEAMVSACPENPTVL